MKEAYSGLTITKGIGSPWTITGFDRYTNPTDRLYVGQVVTVTGTSPAVSSRCIVASITENTSITVTSSDTLAGTGANNTGATITPHLYYMYGHPIEIVNTLSEKGADGTQKFLRFPVICLFQDFEENIAVYGYDSMVELNIVIAAQSKNHWKAADRYTNTFKVSLYHLYNLFLQKLAESDDVNGDNPEHTKIDRLYWGKTGLYGNSGNIFNDFIDAIEIKDLKLKIHKSKC
jgi:hypothetical protein